MDLVWNSAAVAHPLLIERVGEVEQIRSVNLGSSNDSELWAQSFAGMQGELCGKGSRLSLISQWNFTGLLTTPRPCAAEQIEFGATAREPQKEATILNAGRDAVASAQALPQLDQHSCQSWSDQGPSGRTWRDCDFQSTMPAGRVFQEEEVRRRMQAGICPAERLRERFYERQRHAVSGAVVSAVHTQISQGIAVLSPKIHVAGCWGWFPSQLPDPQRSPTLRTRTVGARAGQLRGTKEIREKLPWEQLHWTGQLWMCTSNPVIPDVQAEESGLLPQRARLAQRSHGLERTPRDVGPPVETLQRHCAGTQEPNGRSALRFQLEPRRPQSAEFPCASWPRHSAVKARTIREMCLKT